MTKDNKIFIDFINLNSPEPRDLALEIAKKSEIHHEESMKSLQEAVAFREQEKLRRHNEQVAVGNEQVELLKEQLQKLTMLLHNSRNSIEQRDVIIHFMVQIMMQMETSKKEKEKTLSSVLIQIASFAALGADLTGIYDFVQKQIEELSKD